MELTPKVSLIIPVFNGSDYLHEAIDSALAQTYKNIEIIIVNDGSNDAGKTESIAKSYGPKIRYYFKENGGVASALNAGIREMTGEWFAWLSHDDMFSSNRIEEDINLMRDNPDIRVTFCNIATIDESGNVIKESVRPIRRVTNPYDALKLGGVDMCSMTIHRSCFEQTGLFNEKNITTQDVEMTLRLSVIYPFYLNDRSITYKRDHKRRGTYTLSKQHKKDLLNLCDFIHNELSLQNGFSKDNMCISWLQMGDLYRYFGSIDYAIECYWKGLLSQKNIHIRMIIVKTILATKLLLVYANKIAKNRAI
jgi:glycosyltransferase involved in cell wall biosynthesis